MAKKNIVQKRLLSIKELASEVGGTVWFWRSQIWARRLPYVQVGRKMLIDQQDVHDFIEKHKEVA